MFSLILQVCVGSAILHNSPRNIHNTTDHFVSPWEDIIWGTPEFTNNIPRKYLLGLVLISSYVITKNQSSVYVTICISAPPQHCVKISRFVSELVNQKQHPNLTQYSGGSYKQPHSFGCRGYW